ncbi:uncharacterized protein LOC121377749 [Gigantopelta aegis]|uniref:uncharacterized protein LOC121377749 n=1 Tax=Gigantopelta aegis TaxID=1735272 RepID=UPI001B88BB00|nr:uncharacterized protein LOC121377749 [Gigantopelta aegis]
MDIFNNPVDVVLTPEARWEIANSTHCYLCGEELDYSRHVDHCHLTGKFRGVCHGYCNLNFKLEKEVICVLHNSERYDTHLILQASTKFADRKLSCIPHNTEQFLSFSIDNLIFVDSFKFLTASLDSLTKNLMSKGKHCFVHLKKHFPDHVDMLTRKLPFCYEYIDSFEKLNDTQLPKHKDFYSQLSESNISDEEYTFAKKLWEEFHIKTLEEFMRLYVSVDVLLLCDVMESFRDMCIKSYELDPLHYKSLPGFALDAALKMTDVELDLFTEPDMYGFIEKGLRGGVSMISHRYSKANNKYMSDFDSQKDTCYLMYFDVNSLYATTMLEPLALCDYEFISTEEFNDIDWTVLDTEGELGYILEVDLQYPRELHAKHASFPLAPVHDNIPAVEFSPYCKQLLEQFDLNLNKPSGKKLFCTLKDKNNYVIHFATLKLYLKLGLELKCIHKVLKFKQSKWMKPFVTQNIEKRKHAKDKCSQDLYKAMSNVCYGKFIESVRKYKQVELIAQRERLRRYTAKSNFKHVNIFSEDLVAVELQRTTVTLNKPIAVGFCILEHAKRHILSFYYETMVKQYNDHVRLLMTDTDSLFMEIRHAPNEHLIDPYEFMQQNSHLFDTSNFQPDHVLFSMKSHKVTGLMKDEAGGAVIDEFVGLRAKNYSFTIIDKNTNSKIEHKKAKGIKRGFVKKSLRHELFKQCLFQKKTFSATFNLIRSFNNTLYTIKNTKVALIPLDNKRYILEDGITSVPYGYQAF